MKKNVFIQKLIRAYRKYGIKGLCGRFWVKIWHTVYSKPDVIYFSDLQTLETPSTQAQEPFRVVERTSMEALQTGELEAIDEYIGPEIAMRMFEERFSKQSSLWLLKKENDCVGMIWTIVGTTIEPFYYHIGRRDVHFYNNEIFLPFRGRGYNTGLIESVLWAMKERGLVRAYIETNLRNSKELRSLEKTDFEKMGLAAKLNVGKRNITQWRRSN
ncbi:hypothetical protein ACFL6U_05855 [Planctomycetota bacterium]